MKACIEDGNKEIENSNHFKSIIATFTDNENEFIECCCSDLEKDFDSYDEGDKGMSRVLPQYFARSSSLGPLFKEDDFKTLEDCFGDRFIRAMESMGAVE